MIPLDPQKLFMFAFIGSVLAIGAFSLHNGTPRTDHKTETVPLFSEKKMSQAEYYVFLTGAVRCPGIYQVNEWDRIIDVVKLAGGFRKDADVSLLSLAEKVKDGQKINVPFKQYGPVTDSGPAVEEKFSLNGASAAELDKVPGIGLATAKKIVEFRNRKGPFRSVAELANVPGFSKKKVEKLSPYLDI